MKKCLVLLGTYNGEKYLREQIDSILNQKGVEIFLKVSDDKSTDKTVEILREYAEKYENVSYSVNETNKNFTYNFIDLLFSCSDEYDYYAFSDQDDFWLEDKIAKAIEKIEEKGETEKGALYCSNLVVVDEKLNKISMQEDESIYKTSPKTYLYENIATGCTVVFDKKFFNHALKYYPQNIRLHDYWLFLVAVYTADYIYDFNGYILYRQHGNNQIGTNKRKFTPSHVKKAFKNKGNTGRLINELFSGFSADIKEIYLNDLLVVRDYKKSLRKRFKLAFSRRYKGRVKKLTHMGKVILGLI